MRGEYDKESSKAGIAWELPPRARRIQTKGLGMGTVAGTTSACAENTGVCDWFHLLAWNYLRVRGEYSMPPLAKASIAELPPRARRILVPHGRVHHQSGTTSACAENTMIRFSMLTDLGNYLRVRGEYWGGDES